jgi:hypothetical protein
MGSALLPKKLTEFYLAISSFFSYPIKVVSKQLGSCFYSSYLPARSRISTAVRFHPAEKRWKKGSKNK